MLDNAALTPMASVAAVSSSSMLVRAGFMVVAVAGVLAALVVAFLPILARREWVTRFRVGRWLASHTHCTKEAGAAWLFVSVSWCLRGTAVFLLLNALSLKGSFALALAFLCASAASAALPIAPAGAATQAGAGAAILMASGMKGTEALAFSVAAHLEPEILIVDEVLAVGDAGFQKKCLGKMEDVATGGRTVLFVSHNMQAINSLCDSAIRIEAGRIVDSGEARTVVADYLSEMADTSASITWEPGQGPGDEEVRLTCVQVLDSSGEVANVVSTVDPFSVRMEFDLFRLDEALCIGFDLAASDGTIVMRSYQTDVAQEEWPALQIGRNSIGCIIPAGLLNEGSYFVMPRVSLHCVRWIVNSASVISFQVHRHAGLSPYTLTGRPGTIAPMLPWQTM